MALPMAVQERMMKLFAVSYVGFDDESKMELGLSEFQVTIAKDVENWTVRLRKVIEQYGASQQHLEVYDRFIKRYVR